MNKKRGNIFRKLYVLFFLLLAFSIPIFDRLSALTIVLIIFTWVMEGNFNQKYQRIKRDRLRKNLLFFGLIYVVYLLGLINSSNQFQALLDLQTKLSLLVIPILLATFDFSILKEIKTRIFLFYILGCLITTIILLIHSLIKFLGDYAANEFFYSNLSWYHHASYLSMFLVFATGIMLYQLHTRTMFNNRVGTLYSVLIIYFCLFILLLSSKAGMLSLAAVIISYIGLLLFEGRFVKGVIILIVSGLAIWGMLAFFSVTSSRISDAQHIMTSKAIEKGATDSTSERMLIWQSAISIIKGNMLFGVGTGDVDDVLLERYKTNQYSGALENRLNAHNQYLETFIATGIVGFIILAGMLFIPFYIAFKQGNILYLLLLFLIIFNLLFESMFERQAGVVFYAFFNGLLFIFTYTDKNSG